jgi:hypothetical protein
METNKETSMIYSDEILYAVLKDGTVVSNVREVVEGKDWMDKMPILEKLFCSNLDLLKDIKDYPKPISQRAFLLVSLTSLSAQGRCKAELKTVLDELTAKLEAEDRKKDETDSSHGDDDK